MKYKARSASDKRDDWPFWYVTDESGTRNVTVEAIRLIVDEEFDFGLKHHFCMKGQATAIAEMANAKVTG